MLGVLFQQLVAKMYNGLRQAMGARERGEGDIESERERERERRRLKDCRWLSIRISFRSFRQILVDYLEILMPN